MLLPLNTKPSGAAPWLLGKFTLEQDQSFSITAFGLGADDVVCIHQVLSAKASNPNVRVSGENIILPTDEVVLMTHQLVDEGIKLCLCQAHPWLHMDSNSLPLGDYALSVSGTNIANGHVAITGEVGKSGGIKNYSACSICPQI